MPLAYVGRRLKKFFIYRVLHVDDTPHRIALGVAAGIFVAWTPTIGMQMVLTVVLAALLRANKLVGVPFVWLSNPFTIVPIYGPSFWLGSRLLGGRHTWAEFMRGVREAMVLSGGWIDKVQAWWRAMADVMLPLWMGSIIIGLVLAVVTYVCVYYAVLTYRKHRHELRAAREAVLARRGRRRRRKNASQDPPAATEDKKQPQDQLG